MKPIHAKPQSGRTIETGLALRIVSKRGQTVMFGQTGLLFANRQWITLNFNEQAVVTVVPPIAYTKCLAGIISDTGSARINYGFHASVLQAYAPAGVKDISCGIVMLGY